MRVFVGKLLIKAGMAILPADVRKMVRDVLMYHVPGALSDEERRQVRAAKEAFDAH